MAGDLGGALPMEAGILKTCEQALSAFRMMGMQVDEARLAEDPAEMWRTAVTLRHWSVGADLESYFDDPVKRQMMRPEAIWEVEGYKNCRGLSLPMLRRGGREFSRHSEKRSRHSIFSPFRPRRCFPSM